MTDSIKQLIEDIRKDADFYRKKAMPGPSINLRTIANRLEALVGDPIMWATSDGESSIFPDPDNGYTIPLYRLDGEK